MVHAKPTRGVATRGARAPGSPPRVPMMTVAFCLAVLAAIEAVPGADLSSHNSKEHRKLSFSIQVRQVLLDQPGTDPNAWSPAVGVAIVAPPVERKQSNRLGREWLLRRPPFLERRAHEFDVRDGGLTPVMSIALVGDTVKQTTRDGRRVKIISLDHPGDSGFRTEPFLLHTCDSSPFPRAFVVDEAPESVAPAYIVVSDHGFGRVSNDAGTAVFDQWPVECDMEVMIWCPTIKSKTSMTSRTLQMLPTRKFTVPAGEEDSAHLINIDAAGSR